MLTIFSIPKPFRGHISMIQQNAVESWCSLGSGCEVVLLGDEEGTAEIAARFSLRHVREVARNEYGTPLVSDAFVKGQEAAHHSIVCYVNADIMLMSSFLDAVRRIDRSPFLMIGQRWDVDIEERWDLANPDWERNLRSLVAHHGTLHLPTAVDYFVFPRGLYVDIPPFALGRAVWDHWLVYRARSLSVPVFDATRVATVVHQNHDYSHHQGGKTGTVWWGPEYTKNLQLASMVGREVHPFTVHDATALIDQDGIRPALDWRYLWRRIMAETVLNTRLHPVYRIAKTVREHRRRSLASSEIV